MKNSAVDNSSDHPVNTSPDWSAEESLSSQSPKVSPTSPLPGRMFSPVNGVRVPLNSPDPTASPLPSPKYIPGSFALAKLKMKSPEPSDHDFYKNDPLAMRLHFQSDEQNGNKEGLNLEVSLKSGVSAQRKDLDHLIGVIAREMKRIKEDSGVMPHYRCSGTKLSGRNIQFRFTDRDSLEFYKKTIKRDTGPTKEHRGYYVRGAGDPPPFKKYRAWFPGEMMDCLDTVPDFLALESKDIMNENTIKIIGSSPSTADGFMVYFEVTPIAETFISCFPSGVMCGAHKVKFCQVNERAPRQASSKTVAPKATPSLSSSSDNWRVTSPASDPGMSRELWRGQSKGSSLSRVEEKKCHSRNGSEDRRNSAPDVIQH
ncbi:hypothetical protein ACHWQZ_G016059 [Mnemiopsis leidyi]